MADNDHVFQASGEACPICSALDGTLVSAGFTAHDNCTCQTIPVDNDGGCQHHFAGTTVRHGSGPWDASYAVEITVVCADGTEMGMSTEVDLGGSDESNDFGIDIIDEAVEEIANELCEQCPEPKPWLCC
jgi:hypothetical protein